MISRLALPIAACLTLTGCYKSAPTATEPAPRVIELEKRVTRLEEVSENLSRVATRVAELTQQLGELERAASAGADEEVVAPKKRRLMSGSDEEHELKLAEIDDRLDAIEKKLNSRGAAGGTRPPYRRPVGPDPALVYSVPVTGSPYDGPRYAKVTIVQAFEFA